MINYDNRILKTYQAGGFFQTFKKQITPAVTVHLLSVTVLPVASKGTHAVTGWTAEASRPGSDAVHNRSLGLLKQPPHLHFIFSYVSETQRILTSSSVGIRRETCQSCD